MNDLVQVPDARGACTSAGKCVLREVESKGDKFKAGGNTRLNHRTKEARSKRALPVRGLGIHECERGRVVSR